MKPDLLISIRRACALFAALVLLPVAVVLAVMPGVSYNLFSSRGFMPHAHCYLNNPRMVWLQVTSDMVIGLSYVAISSGLGYIVYKSRRDIPFQWMFLAFGAFIISCGGTHFMEVWTVWHPTYWFSGTVKLITALSSSATAIAFPMLLPKIFQLIRTAKASEDRRKRLEEANAELAILRENERNAAAARLQQSEEGLHRSEARYRSLIAAMTSVVWSTDASGGFIEPQHSWEAYTGQGWPDQKGIRWLEQIHPADRRPVEEAWNAALNARTRYEMEGRLWNAARQEYRYFIARALPIHNADGTVREWVGTVTDIHEKKEAEERVRQMNQVLEQRVEQRTAELQAANRHLEEFTYSVSHDLRAPLRSVQGFAQSVLEDYDDKLDETGRSHLRRMVTSAHRMDALIRDLLEYSRMTRLEVSLERVRLEDAGREALVEVESAIQEKTAEVQMNLPASDCTANRRILVQVLVNLLSNALKYVAPQVKPKVRVWAEQREDQVRVLVQDNGIGIAAEHQASIFRPFERLHGADVYPGTGIGLAIVQKGIERMHGKVGVFSQVGKGSTFWIELPRA